MAALVGQGSPIGSRGRAPSTVSARGRPGQQSATRAASLSNLIETEIIPRLLAAHSLPLCEPSAPAPVAAIDPAEVAAFAPLALEVEADELFDHVEGIRCRGVPVDVLLIDLLAPAARLLGEYWEEDRCDFLEVTVGLWRLQEVLHRVSERAPAACWPKVGRAALFASMPGDQHCFGTVVIDEVFAREGWETVRLCDAGMSELLARVANERFDLVGLTVSCDCHIERLPSVIGALRSVSRNPRVRVMVGGRLFAADAGLALRVGADGTATDAKKAVRLAANLLAEVEREAVC